jgi:hypothetical protein
MSFNRDENKYTARIDALKAVFMQEMRVHAVTPPHMELAAQVMAHTQFLRALLSQDPSGKLRQDILDELRRP